MKAILARILGFAAQFRAMASVAAVVAPVIVGAAMFESASAAIDNTQKAGHCVGLPSNNPGPGLNPGPGSGSGNSCNQDVHVRYQSGSGAQVTIVAGGNALIPTPLEDGYAVCFAPFYPVNAVFPGAPGMLPTWDCDDGMAAAAPGGGSDSGSGGADKTTSTEHFALGVGVIILAGAAFGAWQNGDSSAFSMTPVSRHSYSDGAWRTRHGTRLNYHGDEWSLWWSAETENTFGDESGGELNSSSFGWGGAWRGDAVYVDAAALISDSGTDLRAGAGADLDVYGWALRPTWRVHAEALDSGRWDSRMDAAVAAEWARLGWNVRPSLGATGSLRDAAESEAFMRLRVERTLGW